MPEPVNLSPWGSIPEADSLQLVRIARWQFGTENRGKAILIYTGSISWGYFGICMSLSGIHGRARPSVLFSAAITSLATYTPGPTAVARFLSLILMSQHPENVGRPGYFQNLFSEPDLHPFWGSTYLHTRPFFEDPGGRNLRFLWAVSVWACLGPADQPHLVDNLTGQAPSGQV